MRKLLLITLLLTFSVQVAAQESCELDEVKIGFQAQTCPFWDYSIKLNGAEAEGFGTNCISFEQFPNKTNKAWTRLKLNKTYLVEAGTGLCITHINFDVPEGYVMYIDGIESKTIFKTNNGEQFSGDGQWNVVIRKKCSCSKDGGGQATPMNGSVIWEVGMGLLRDGRSAERISIREKQLTPAIYTPAALVYSEPGLTDEVDVVKNLDGTLRQVKAPQTLADIFVVSPTEYEIRYYNAADVGAKVGGVYQLSGQPYVTWNIKNPTPGTFSKLEISKIENGIQTDKTEYTWDAAIDTWTLRTGWTSPSTFARTETKIVTYPTSSSRAETFVVKNAGGDIVTQKTKTYLNYPWGEELVQEVIDPEGFALTTTYAYYDTPSETHRYQKVKSVIHPDGSWTKYDYDAFWNISTITRPWKDQALATADASNSHVTIYGYSNSDNGVFGISVFRRILFDVEEKINGITVRKSRYSRSIAGVDPDMISVTDSSYSGSTSNGVPVNLLSQSVATTYRFSAPEFLANRPAWNTNAHGAKDTYTYEQGNYLPNPDPSLSVFVPDVNGLSQRRTIVHGTNTAPNGVAFKTTKETVVSDQFGNQVLQESYVYNGTDYERFAWTVNDYDSRGHVTQTRNHKGELTTAVWTGEQKSSEIDSSGIETVYEYDSLNRINKQTKKGIAAGGGFPAQNDIVTTLGYNAEGKLTSETVTGGGLSLTNTREFDRAGRLSKETNPAQLSTVYSYSNGGRTQTVTLPGGATQITDRYLDWQTRTVSGTSLVTRYFDYGVNPDGTRYTQEYTGSGGLSSPRWTRITTDWMGRQVAVEKPSFTGVNVITASFYNSLNQLQSETTTANGNKQVADRLFEYDELGRELRSGSDVDNSGTLTLVSTDRLQESEDFFEKIGSDWFHVTTAKTYVTDNNDTPIIQTQRERLNNFPANGAELTVSELTLTDVANNNTKTTIAIERAAKKRIVTTDTPDSNLNAVRISVNGLVQSSTATTPQSATTYTYDGLGRQLSITDPRTGTISQTFNTSGQVATTNDGVGTTTLEYYPSAHLNAGRLKSQANAASKKAYFAYNSRGEVTQTWGDTTYPMQYVYDAYGQRTELHTFRAGQNWTANVWPASTTGTADVSRWTYQESTGLVTQKQDAALKGAGYTYDELGRVKTRVWARGITCTYGYDANTGELRTVTYSDSTPAVSFTYDRGGRPGTITDAAGSHTRTFNAAGELQTEQISGGVLDGVNLTVGFDGFLRRNSLQSTHGTNTLSSQAYGYDATSRLDTVSSGSQTATYAYHANSGLWNTTTFNGGTNTARTYDTHGRLETITTTPSAAPAESYAYTYNNLNQRTRVTREDGGYWSYDYNDRGELIAGKKYWSDNATVWGAQREYNFDNLGNLSYLRQGGNQLGALRQSNYTTNSLNQYSQRTVPGAVDVTGTANTAAKVTVNNEITARKNDYFYREFAVDNTTAPAYPQINLVGARNNFGGGGQDAVSEKGGRAFVPAAVESSTYDFDGNLVGDGRWIYTWDAENRLVRMEAAVSAPVEAKSKLEFAYDSMGRRIEKSVYGWNDQSSSYQLQSTTKFVYDGWNLIAELNGANALTRSFTWGRDVTGSLHEAGGIGALLLVSEAGSTHQVGYDGNGNVSVLINVSTGAVAGSYEYDPLGNSVKVVGPYANSNPFKFSTKYVDAETDLIYYGYRYYNASTGRWLNRDPKEEAGGINLYSFVLNNAVSQIDPLGLESRAEWEERAKATVGYQKGVNALTLNRRITAAYGVMYKRNPRIYVWAGAAAFASDLVGRSMAQALNVRTNAGNPLLAAIMVFGGAPTGRELYDLLARGNLYVYADLYWQHLAYDGKGIDEMSSLKQRQELPDSLYRAWCLIDKGKKENDSKSIWEGNQMLLEFEQRYTLQRVFDHHQRALKWLSDKGYLEKYGIPIYESPVPGDKSLYKFNPNANFGVFEDRWRWIAESVFPAWKQLTEKDPQTILVLIDQFIKNGK